MMEDRQEEVVKYNDEGLNFLKKQDIKEMSSRTFIQEGELKRFLSEDFHGINKTKAMGFIQILQREYGVDLSSLKDRYLSYHSENQATETEPKPSMIMEEVESEERKKGFFSLLFLVGAIGLMGYIVDKYDLLNFSSPNDIKTATVITKDEIKPDTINLDKLSKPETPKIVKEPRKEEKVVASEIKEDSKKELSLNDVLSPNNTKTNTTTDKQEQQQNNPKEDVKVEQNSNNNDIDLSQLNSDLSKNDTANDTESKVVEDEATSTENSETTNSDATTDELYITPSSKVWIGTIDIDTLKKKDFLAPRGKRVDIDTSKNKLIMIGHKFVKMYLNGERVHFKRKGPIRFKYIDGELTEINRKEFNELAKGRQW